MITKTTFFDSSITTPKGSWWTRLEGVFVGYILYAQYMNSLEVYIYRGGIRGGSSDSAEIFRVFSAREIRRFDTSVTTPVLAGFGFERGHRLKSTPEIGPWL